MVSITITKNVPDFYDGQAAWKIAKWKKRSGLRIENNAKYKYYSLKRQAQNILNSTSNSAYKETPSHFS